MIFAEIFWFSFVTKNTARITCIGDVNDSLMDQSYVCSASSIALSISRRFRVSSLQNSLNICFSFLRSEKFINPQEGLLQCCLKILLLICFIIFKLDREMLFCKKSCFESTMSIENSIQLSICVKLWTANMSIFHGLSPSLHATHCILDASKSTARCFLISYWLC